MFGTDRVLRMTELGIESIFITSYTAWHSMSLIRNSLSSGSWLILLDRFHGLSSVLSPRRILRVAVGNTGEVQK